MGTYFLSAGSALKDLRPVRNVFDRNKALALEWATGGTWSPIDLKMVGITFHDTRDADVAAAIVDAMRLTDLSTAV